MKIFKTLIFPALMLVGIILSAFVILVSAQAAVTLPATAPVHPDVTLATGNAEEGRVLFVSKGCIVCHNNDRIAENTVLRMQFTPNTPNLSSVKIDPDYLRRWLRDPDVMKPGVEMPDLNLTEAEIESLVAFLVSPAGEK